MIITVPSSSEISTKLSQVLEFVFSPFLPKVGNTGSEVEQRKERRKRNRDRERRGKKKNEVSERKRKITFKSFLFSFFQMTQ